MRVLIPGGAGYIGSVLTGQLLSLGYAVTVLDNLSFKQKSLFGYASNPNFEFVYGDVLDRSVLQPLISRCDAIVPLAALVGAPACQQQPELAQSLNCGGARLVSELASTHQCIIFPSTNSVYGSQSGDSPCTESTPIAPVSIYGTSKADGEKAVLDSGKGVAFRLATVFGTSPRMRTDLLVNDITYRAVFDGSIVVYEGHYKRNFVGIRDVAMAFVFAIENFAAMRGEVYNLGLDSANLSKIELCQKVKEYVPDFNISEAPIGSDPDKRDYFVSNIKLRHAGFEASQSLDSGICELLKLYKMMPVGLFGRS